MLPVNEQRHRFPRGNSRGELWLVGLDSVASVHRLFVLRILTIGAGVFVKITNSSLLLGFIRYADIVIGTIRMGARKPAAGGVHQQS